MLSGLSPKKAQGYRSLQLKDEELEGLELIPKSLHHRTIHHDSAEDDAHEDIPLDLEDEEASDCGSEENDAAVGWRAVLKKRDKEIRPKVIAVVMVLATLACIILAFNPGGEVDNKTRGLARKADLCHYQGSTLPPLRQTAHSYSLALELGPHLLTPNPTKDASFQGNVSIRMSITKATTCLLLHSHNLTISSISFSHLPPGKPDAPPPKERTCICGHSDCHFQSCAAAIRVVSPHAGLISIPLGKKPLRPHSTLLLEAQYSGLVFGVQQQFGIWSSLPYPLPSGGKGVLLSTQPELGLTRYIMPSLDEPLYKATFAMSVAVPPKTLVLSNMPEVSRKPYPLPSGPPLELVEFQPTPPMPTYTLGLVVGALVSKAAVTKSNKKIQVWAPPGREAHMVVPLKVAVAAVEHYEQWTGVPAPLPKFDLVAVPGKLGAMENWGVLQFDPDRFLVNPRTEGAWGLWRSADVICHEVAHQWFGNYVTCTSEEDMMVNEGLASLMEYGCVEAVMPALSATLLMHRAVNPLGGPLGVHEGVRHRALSTDADPNAAPIRGSKESGGFTTATYSKGAALLHMARSYLDSVSPGAFQAGIKNYLATHALGSATVEDLLRSLAAGVPSSPPPTPAGPAGRRLLRDGDEGDNDDTHDDTHSGSSDEGKKDDNKDNDKDKDDDNDDNDNDSGFSPDAFVKGMLKWTTAQGYPLVRVGVDDPVVLTQERFCAWGALSADLRSTSCSGSANASYFLPLSIGPLAPLLNSTGAVPLPAQSPAGPASAVMRGREWELPDEMVTNLEDPWVLQKGGVGGVFRVLHPELQRAALLESLENLNISSGSGAGQALPAELTRQVEGAAEAASVVDDVLQIALSAPTAGAQPPIAAVEALQWVQSVASLPETSNGVGGYALMLPVLRALHQLHDLLAADPLCHTDLRRFTKSLLGPHADRLLGPTMLRQSVGDYIWTQGGPARNEAFERLIHAPLVTLSALVGHKAAAATLCKEPAPSTPGPSAELLDAHHVVIAVQPSSCNISDPTLRQAYVKKWAHKWAAQEDEADAYRALTALAYAGGAAYAQGEAVGHDILMGLLGLPGAIQLPNVPRSLAIAQVAIMAHTPHLLGRAPRDPAAEGHLGAVAVLGGVMEHWEDLAAAGWNKTRWKLLEEVAAVAVTTQSRYASLRQWLLGKKEASAASGAAGKASQEPEKALRVLSRAHGSLLWRASQAVPACQWLKAWKV